MKKLGVTHIAALADNTTNIPNTATPNTPKPINNTTANSTDSTNITVTADHTKATKQM